MIVDTFSLKNLFELIACFCFRERGFKRKILSTFKSPAKKNDILLAAYDVRSGINLVDFEEK